MNPGSGKRGNNGTRRSALLGAVEYDFSLFLDIFSVALMDESGCPGVKK